MILTNPSVAALIYKLGNPPRSTSSSTRTVPPEAIFTAWLNHHARPFPPGTGKRLFRLLFPHEGSRRRYGLRETRLATELEDVLAIPGLTRWDAVGSSGVEGAGCLGHVVQSALTRRETGIKSGLTLARVDALLDELAASSTFSQLSQRSQEAKSSHDPLAVLHTLYRDSGLSPCAAGALTQIILRDLRPLLAPPPRAHPALQLRTTVTASPAYLTLPAAMKVWDPRMVRAYRAGLGCLDACADAAETGEVHCGPVLGVNVDVSC